MAFGMWIGRTILSVFFVAGYLTYYDSAFYQRLRTERGNWQKRGLNTAIRIGIMLGVAIGLQWAAVSVQQGGDMYVNLLLFVISYALLDEGTSIVEYLFNWAVMSFFWSWIIHLGIWDMKSHLAGLKATFGALRILTEQRSW